MGVCMWDANGTSRTRPTLVWAWPEARSLHIASMATGSIPYSFRNLPLGSLTCLGPIPVHGTTLVLGPMRQTSIYISAWIYLSRIWTRDLSITLIDQGPYSHGHSTLIYNIDARYIYMHVKNIYQSPDVGGIIFFAWPISRQYEGIHCLHGKIITVTAT